MVDQKFLKALLHVTKEEHAHKIITEVILMRKKKSSQENH